MKLQGWIPNWEKLFEQWIITLVEHNSFWLFLGLAIIAILCLNLLNNIIAIVRRNIDELWDTIRRKK